MYSYVYSYNGSRIVRGSVVLSSAMRDNSGELMDDNSGVLMTENGSQ